MVAMLDDRGFRCASCPWGYQGHSPRETASSDGPLVNPFSKGLNLLLSLCQRKKPLPFHETINSTNSGLSSQSCLTPKRCLGLTERVWISFPGLLCRYRYSILSSTFPVSQFFSCFWPLSNLAVVLGCDAPNGTSSQQRPNQC